ncbi:hypothetical protein [Janthinobacterium sp. PSPC3-1]|uniref:hypothetical protein n=1 Tax=Janthinobacterium sp. PSPC3-1 TaxID=2804653 RepID=UPI003CED6767
MSISAGRDADNALPLKRSTVVATKRGWIEPKTFGVSDDIGWLVIDAPGADKSGIALHFWPGRQYGKQLIKRLYW